MELKRTQKSLPLLCAVTTKPIRCIFCRRLYSFVPTQYSHHLPPTSLNTGSPSLSLPTAYTLRPSGSLYVFLPRSVTTSSGLLGNGGNSLRSLASRASLEASISSFRRCAVVGDPGPSFFTESS